MLTVKKIKLHGMTNDRWNTTDKIVQYKGLAALYGKYEFLITVINAVQ